MGTFKWPLGIASIDGHQHQDIEVVVGTGAFTPRCPLACCAAWGSSREVSAGFFWPVRGGSIWTMDRPGLR